MHPRSLGILSDTHIPHRLPALPPAIAEIFRNRAVSLILHAGDVDEPGVLDTLSTVAPDLRDLLDVSRVMNELLGAVPGLGRVKRRVEVEQAEEDAFEYRAGEEPASVPDRHPTDDDAAATNGRAPTADPAVG